MEKLSKIYQELINEDLEYSHSTTNGPESNKFDIGVEISEDISVPNLRMSNNELISDEEINKIKNILPNELKIEQGDYDGKIVNMLINLPWESKVNDGGIIADIQVINIINVNLYQIHIDINQNIRNLGLGYKTYVALINDLGHLYSGKGRQMNTSEIPKIWSKLNSENNIETYKNNRGTIAILTNNPDKDKILKALGF